jgi:hypothetical protein
MHASPGEKHVGEDDRTILLRQECPDRTRLDFLAIHEKYGFDVQQ